MPMLPLSRLLPFISLTRMTVAVEKLLLSLCMLIVHSLVSMRSDKLSSDYKLSSAYILKMRNTTGIMMRRMKVPTVIVPLDILGGPTFCVAVKTTSLAKWIASCSLSESM